MITGIAQFPHIKQAYEQAVLQHRRRHPDCSGCGEADIERKFNQIVQEAIRTEKVKRTTQTLYPGIHVDPR